VAEATRNLLCSSLEFHDLIYHRESTLIVFAVSRKSLIEYPILLESEESYSFSTQKDVMMQMKFECNHVPAQIESFNERSRASKTVDRMWTILYPRRGEFAIV
jgi:hypothetical protein